MSRKQSFRDVDRRRSSVGEAWDDGTHLTEAERAATIDRILRATNPNMFSVPVYFDFKKEERKFKNFSSVDHTAIHFSMDGNSILKESAEAKNLVEERERRHKELELAEEAERNPDLVEKGVSTRILKNQFNYSERASQTLNNPLKRKAMMTDPPPALTLANMATQWEIYDAYEEERRLADERAQAGRGRGRGGKDGDDKARAMRDARSMENDDILTSAAYAQALKIMERMVNQNDNHEIIDDYKYWEDESDEFKEDGNLLPLWKFHSTEVKRKEVTSMAWSTTYGDMFAVGYGSYDFLKQGTGLVQCFTLKNAFPQQAQAHPEFAYKLDSGVMCLDFHPKHPSYLACGLYDGSVCVFDLRQKNTEKKTKPVFQSTVKTGKHTDPVWEVHWSTAVDVMQFFSISSDGRVTSWTLAKNELQHADVMKLTMADTLEKKDDPEAALIGLAGGTCFDFMKKDENIFIVGTEEGHIRRCSKAYNACYLDTYEGHHMAVYAVRWNAFHPDVFLSCSADWTVKLWEKSSSRPLMSFDLSSSVGDVAWAPYSATVFAAVTADGKVHVFDLIKNKNEPQCAQAVVKNTKLTRLCFNPKEPILLVGDGRGAVLSLKLSPNLRRRHWKVEKGEVDDATTAAKKEKSQLDELIRITLKDRELLDDQ